jgi:ABC-type polysaccharide/polyol phosphate transport system ATPase subunit
VARLVLDNVSVRFPIFTAQTQSLRAAVFTRLGGKLASHDGTVVVDALRNVSLKLDSGDRLGVIGHNGAGKTTFLRVISGAYPPVDGNIIRVGKVSSFTDITLGMDKEATGWQNIIFRCIVMGLTFAEARVLAPAIAEFSELGDYMNLPARTYSSGMFLRLAFAISTAVQPDIVVMDEMVGAGDKAFMEKARQRILDLLAKSRILVLASHREGLLRQLCNKIVWLHQGEVRGIGPVDELLREYKRCQQ